eukprot:5240978-Pyramimonas_sp.AAC.1
MGLEDGSVQRAWQCKQRDLPCSRPCHACQPPDFKTWPWAPRSTDRISPGGRQLELPRKHRVEGGRGELAWPGHLDASFPNQCDDRHRVEHLPRHAAYAQARDAQPIRAQPLHEAMLLDGGQRNDAFWKL